MEMLWRNPNIELYIDEEMVKSFSEEALAREVSDANVDVLVIEMPINQMESPYAILDAAGRVLKRNGQLYMAVLIIEGGHTLLSSWHYRHKCKKLGARFSLDEIERFIEKTGFIINRNTIEEKDSGKVLNLELIKLENDTLSKAVSI